MDQSYFHNLCQLLSTIGGLQGTINVRVKEMTAMFLNIIGYYVNNWIIRFDYVLSGEMGSQHFHVVLKLVIFCLGVLLKKQELVPKNPIDSRWK